VDNRPTSNYGPLINHPTKNGTINFTGDSIALYGYLASGQSVYFSIDGIPVGSASIASVVRRDSITDQMFWGISGLSDTSHTLTMDHDYVNSYRVRDFTALYTDTITYKCVVDGVSHTVAISSGLVPDRQAVSQSILARMLAAYNSSQPFGTTYVEEPIATLAGMYLMASPLQKTAVYNLAVTEYNRYLNNSNATTGISSNNYSMDSRIGYSFHMAYNVFKSDYPAFGTQLLAVVDKVVGTYKNTPGSYPSDIDGLLSVTAGHFAYNQVVAYAYSSALAYNEPASSWYHNSALHTYIWALLESCYSEGCFVGSKMPYSLPSGTDPEDSYALFQAPMFWYVADTLGWRASEVATVTAWLADRFDDATTQQLAEPFFYFSSYYDGIQPGCALRRLHAYYRTHGTMPSELVSALFSAATDTNDYTTYKNEYYPDGYNAVGSYSVLNSDPLDCWIFQAAAALALDGVPFSAWAWGGTTPPTPSETVVLRIQGVDHRFLVRMPGGFVERQILQVRGQDGAFV
jgi:hypothetical protein